MTYSIMVVSFIIFLIIKIIRRKNKINKEKENNLPFFLININ
jgi:hypothetical protein